MKFGMNMLLWTGELNEAILPMLAAIKSMGYDGVELPLFNPHQDVTGWGQRLDDLGLQRTAVTIRGLDDNPISPDINVRKRGVENTCRAIDQCVTIGCQVLCGPYHSALGHFSGNGPSQDEWNWALESMQQIAEYAQPSGVDTGRRTSQSF